MAISLGIYPIFRQTHIEQETILALSIQQVTPGPEPFLALVHWDVRYDKILCDSTSGDLMEISNMLFQ